jgi:hypothetical protein
MKPPTYIAFALVAAWIGCAAAPAAAHHSVSMYDRNHPITVEGVVREFRWSNPHAMLEMATEPKPGQPSKIWVIELSSPGVMTRAGWTKRSLAPGDRIAAELGPLRDGRPGGVLSKVTFPDGRVLNWSFLPSEKAGLD